MRGYLRSSPNERLWKYLLKGKVQISFKPAISVLKVYVAIILRGR
jgi:hypothetical protein